MTHVRFAFLVTAAAGLIAIAAPAFAKIVETPDGQYYRLVPVRAPVTGTAPEMVTIPGQATASGANLTLGTRRFGGQTAGIDPKVRGSQTHMGTVTGRSSAVVGVV
jgi:hypothetical protein